MNDILNYSKYVKENTYKITDGNVEKKEWEYYKDFYPEKWNYINMTDNVDKQIFNGNFVWIIKHNDVFKMILSDTIEEEEIKKIINIIE